MKRSPVTLLAASALLVGGAVASSPAAAGGHGHSPRPDDSIDSARRIADGLLTPLSLAVDDRGRALVSQNFLGELLRITPDGTRSTIATAPGEELGAVSTRGRTTYWATTGQDPATPSAKLFAQRASGEPRQIADLRAFEAANNPDAATSYGFQGLPAECAAQFPDDFPATSTGVVDSHPYATYASGSRVYVADAGANAILSVKTGRRAATPKVVAVLPPVGAVVTAEAAAAQGLPACAAGYTYHFDFVPTDVEKGRDGWLYVTSLPGGPEDASLGARGAVYKVNPYSGAVRRVAGGFVGAVNLALGPDGTMAVAELFGGDQGQGQVTLVKPRSSHRTVLPFTAPGAIEWTGSSRHSKLYVTTDAFVPNEQGPQPIGTLQVLKLGKDRRGWHHHH
jgi:hypothetical protein